MARYGLRVREASATPAKVSRRRRTKSRALSKHVDGPAKVSLSQDQTVLLLSKGTTTSNVTQAHSHSQPVHSTITAANGNHMVIDLIPLNISMAPADMTKSYKLETLVQPYLLSDPNNNNEAMPTYVCYTHLKETIVEKGEKPERKSMPRGLDMPSLDFEPCPAEVADETTKTPEIVVEARAKRAAASGKSNNRKRPKPRLNAGDILQQMIRDERIVTQYQSGEKLRVNIVCKNDVGAKKRNYRKACYKPVIDRLLSNPFPNTSWGSVSPRGASNVTVLSDIVVRSSRDDERNNARSTPSTRRKLARRLPIVEIFTQSDDDCSEVIDVLGPDYIPVVRRRKKKRSSTKTAPKAVARRRVRRDVSADLRLRPPSDGGDPLDEALRRQTPTALWRKGKPVVVVERMTAAEMEKYRTVISIRTKQLNSKHAPSVQETGVDSTNNKWIMEKRTEQGHNVVTKTDKDVAEIRYPVLDVTVARSPHSFRNSPRRRGLLEGRSPRVRTPRRARTTPGKSAAAASRILNFGSGATQQDRTIVEESIECRHRPAARPNVPGITQLKRRVAAHDKHPQSEVMNVGPGNVDSLKLARLHVTDEKSKEEDVDSDCSAHSHELFSPEARRDDENSARQAANETSQDDSVDVASPSEASITPYQANQPADDDRALFDSQRSLFDNAQTQWSQTTTNAARNGTRNETECVTSEGNDRNDEMFARAGPSNWPGLLESAIGDASGDASRQISAKHDLTAHLDAVDNMAAAHANGGRHPGRWRAAYVTPKYRAPSVRLIAETMSTYDIPERRTVAPFYGDPRHVTGAVDVGHNTLRILPKDHRDEFRGSFASLADRQRTLAGACGAKDLRRLKLSCFGGASRFVRPARTPPSAHEVRLWSSRRRRRRCADVDEEEEVACREVEDSDATLLGLDATPNESRLDASHAISSVSLDNTHGYKMTLENLQAARSSAVYQYVTSLAVELHAESRGDNLPDPQVDAVRAIFFALADDMPDATQNEHFVKGFVAVGGDDVLEGSGVPRTKHVFVVADERALYAKFLALFHGWNPDILMGYEIERASWGYLVERGYALGLNVPAMLSRIKVKDVAADDDAKEREELHAHLKVTGRIVLDLWRILKHEIALQSYAFENLAYHVLHERAPRHSARELHRWWCHASPKYRRRTVDYYLYRTEGCLRLVDRYDLVGRTAELARLFGVLFYEVLSRGSQFRVESMMLRLAKPYGYVPVSPSVQQRAGMRAPEHLPLILEPESRFYADPVLVLDFQSLYPSIIIAYNYCYSTCLGRVELLADGQRFAFGAYELEVERELLAALLATNRLTVSPCGVAFVADGVRVGVMPRMLREILDARLMVKRAMKRCTSDSTLQKVLHSRQLGLKLIANVTYGYAAANFSGRMPAAELADSVVAKGRETLRRAVALVERRAAAWGARVVYGDTDSLFVLCAGRSRAEAFRVGEEIVDAVTGDNPSPVRLKLEKVYQPCVLQTKKRYVGYAYESVDQKVPEFEAKGIETVRRDGCPAASKMLEKCLRLLFDSRDVSQVREYVLRQFAKILSGRASIQDLTFAKEYRGRDGYRPGACVPALELARKWTSADKRREPRSGERVPYVIVNGPPGLPLIKLVRSPHDLLEDASLRPNALYYITKAIIPPINRCFKLIGADLFNWFNEMPRKQAQYLHVGSPSKGPKSTISQYFATAACAACGVQTMHGVCANCLDDPQSTVVTLHKRIYQWERRYFSCRKICESCCGRSTELSCNSLDCPVLYRLKQTYHDVQQTDYVRSLLEKFPESNRPELF